MPIENQKFNHALVAGILILSLILFIVPFIFQIILDKSIQEVNENTSSTSETQETTSPDEVDTTVDQSQKASKSFALTSVFYGCFVIGDLFLIGSSLFFLLRKSIERIYKSFAGASIAISLFGFILNISTIKDISASGMDAVSSFQKLIDTFSKGMMQ